MKSQGWSSKPRSLASNRIEPDRADQTAASFEFQGERYRRNRKTPHKLASKFGTIHYPRWYYQNKVKGRPGLAPLDVRLGVIAGYATSGLAEVTGRLAGDMPQEAAREVIAERFAARPSVATYRNIIADTATLVRSVHDQAAIEQIHDWFTKARKTPGKSDVLLQVGRDGVFVQTRPCWEEASCATFSVYDRNRKRLGTVYLGQMPESEQPTLSRRMTNILQGSLRNLKKFVPTLRYVTDAGCHPQSYYHDVLCSMTHPETSEPLRWSWGVDFYHACEYVTKLATSIYGAGTQAASDWASAQRRTLRDEVGGLSKVLCRAAQQKRRHKLSGCESDYESGRNYLRRYSKYMDFAERQSRGEPIGSGPTEAGCKVIFNQRMKQSGMRWHRETGQFIVDLRTAMRSGIWSRCWQKIQTTRSATLPNYL